MPRRADRKEITKQPREYYALPFRDSGLFFSYISAVDVIRSVHKSRSDALAADGVPFSFIKMSLLYSLPTILHILDTSYISSIFHHFGKGRISPKFPLPLSPKIIASPTSLLCSLLKVLERVVHGRTGFAIPYNQFSVLTIALISRSVRI